MPIQRVTVVVGGLVLALIAAPVTALHSQVVAPGTNPRGTDTATTTRQDTTSRGAARVEEPSATAQAGFKNDLPFVNKAGSANAMEIQLGNLAQARATNSAVKQFGQRMVSDHTRLQTELTATASQNRVTFRPEINAEHQQQIRRLQSLSGPEFDRTYMTLMIQDHQTDLNHFENESRTANSPQVRALASRTIPVLQQHLTLARQVGSQVGVSVAANPETGKVPVAAAKTGQTFNLKGSDTRFVHEVAADNMLEVLLGQLAAQKGQDAEVRQYGQRENTDHNRLQDEWMAMAANGGAPFQAKIGKNHRAKLHKLEKLSGRDFDRAYMTMVIQNHKDYIDYLEKEGRALKTSQVRDEVERDIPVYKSHFNEAKRIGAKVGANTAVFLRSEKASK